MKDRISEVNFDGSDRKTVNSTIDYDAITLYSEATSNTKRRARKRSRKKIVFICCIVLIMVAGGAVAAALILTRDGSDKDGTIVEDLVTPDTPGKPGQEGILSVSQYYVDDPPIDIEGRCSPSNMPGSLSGKSSIVLLCESIVCNIRSQSCCGFVLASRYLYLIDFANSMF